MKFSRWALVALLCSLVIGASGCGGRQDQTVRYPALTQHDALPDDLDALRALRDAEVEDAHQGLLQAYLQLLYVDVDRSLDTLLSPVFDDAAPMLRIARMALLLVQHEDAIDDSALRTWVEQQDDAQMLPHERVLFTELRRAFAIDSLVRDDADALPSALPYGGADSWRVFGGVSRTWIDATTTRGDAADVKSLADLPQQGIQRLHTYPTQLGKLTHNPLRGDIAYYESFVRVDEPTQVAVTRFDAQDMYTVWIGDTPVLSRGVEDSLRTSYQAPVVDLEPGVHRVLMVVYSQDTSVQPPHLIPLHGALREFDADAGPANATEVRRVEDVTPDLSASLAQNYAEDPLTWLVHASVAMLSDESLAYALAQATPHKDHPLMTYIRAHLLELAQDAPAAESLALQGLRAQDDAAQEEFAGLALKEAQILFASSQDIDALKPLAPWIEREEAPALVRAAYVGMLRRLKIHALAFQMADVLRKEYPQWCEAWSEYLRLALEERDLLLDADFDGMPETCPAVRDVHQIITEQWRGKYDNRLSAEHRALARSAFARQRVSDYFWDLLKIQGVEPARKFLDDAESYGLNDADTIGERAALALIDAGEDALEALLEDFVAKYPARKDTLRVLASLADRPLLQELRIDGLEVLQAYRASKEAHTAQTEIVEVLNYQSWRVFESGAAVRINHQMYELNSRSAIEQFAELDVDRGSEILQLRVIKPDGSIRSPERRQSKESLSLPDMKVGDIVEMESLATFDQEFDGTCRITPQKYHFTTMLSAVFHAEFRLRVPERCEDTIQLEVFHVDENPQKKTRDGDREYVLTQNNLAPVVREDATASFLEWGPWVRFFTEIPLEEQVRIYQQHLLPRVVVDETVRARAHAVTKGLKKDADKIRAIFVDVRDHIEEEGSFFVSNARRAARAEQGDHLSLLYAMLKAEGFAPDVALVQTMYAPQIPSDYTVTDDFDDVVLRVKTKQKTYWLSLEGDYRSFEPLPAYMAGSRALLLTAPDAGELVTLPEGEPQEHSTVYDTELWLDENGDARAQWTLTMHGDAAEEFRHYLGYIHSDQELLQYLEEYLGDAYGQVSIDTVHVDQRKDVDSPLIFRLEGRIDRLADWTNENTLTLDTTLHPALLLRRLTESARRTMPLHIPPVPQQVAHIHIHPPEGYARVRNVAPVDERYQKHRYTRALENAPSDDVAWTQTLTLAPSRVAVDAYPAFAEYGQKVRNLERIRLEWSANP